MAVDKTRNMEHPGTIRNIPEHPGTSNNHDNYEKKMCQLKFWACSRDHLKRSEWSRRSRNMFLFVYFEMNRTEELSTVRKKLKKYMRSLIIDDILSEGGNVST